MYIIYLNQFSLLRVLRMYLRFIFVNINFIGRQKWFILFLSISIVLKC